MPTIDRNLRWAAEAFFACPHTCTVLGSSTGFSGSAFARVETKDRTWCLRRWPVETAPATLAWIHAVLRHSRSRGFHGVPRIAAARAGETVVWLDTIAFDAQEWVAGMSLIPAVHDSSPVPNPVFPVSIKCLVQVAAALAEFHQSTNDFSPPLIARRPSLMDRLTAMRSELERQRVAIETWVEVEPSGEPRELAEAWLSLLPSAIARAVTSAAAHATLPDAACVAIHGDLWAPHVFFAGASFSGLVDFESLAWDAPEVDLAQLILHFSGWDERAAILDAYGEHRALTAVDRALLPAAGVLDLAGEGIWSLGILAAAAGRPSHHDRHLANLRALFPALHALSAS